MWSMLSAVRTSPLVGEMIETGELIEVAIEDSPRRYLAVPSFFKRRRVTYDNRVRILGPLDPLIWDRDLVRHIFDFEYVWEVYKPAPQRRWGWYVCPLLHRDRLIGRIEARVEKGTMVVSRVWMEEGAPVDIKVDLSDALERHAGLCGATKVRMPAKKASRKSLAPHPRFAHLLPARGEKGNE